MYIPRPVYSPFILVAFAVCVRKANSVHLIRQNRVVLIFQSRQRLHVILAILISLYSLRPLIIELINCVGILFAAFQSLLLLAPYILLRTKTSFAKKQIKVNEIANDQIRFCSNRTKLKL